MGNTITQITKLGHYQILSTFGGMERWRERERKMLMKIWFGFPRLLEFQAQGLLDAVNPVDRLAFAALGFFLVFKVL